MVSVPTGVIEGFYGPPWTQAARLRCIEHLAEWGMTHYVWAAKLEPRHRERWAEPFTSDELAGFSALAAHRPTVALGVALTPGPDATADEIVAKLGPAVEAGASVLVLSFDDLAELTHGARHGALARAVVERLSAEVWVVPTHYAGGEPSPYLDALCDGLPAEVLVMWTGPAVVTESITGADAAARARATGDRAPMLWDNVPVNDLLMADRLHLGPLTGRSPDLLDGISGVLWNPMEQAEASLLTLRSCAAWAAGEDPLAAWSAEIDRRELRPFVEGVLGWVPDDDASLRTWLEAVAACDAPGLEAEVQPWLDAVRSEARLGLRALDLLDLVRIGEAGPEEVAAAVMALASWRRVRSADVSVFGGRLLTTPIADQDDQGRFRLLPGAVTERSTAVDRLVRRALHEAGIAATAPALTSGRPSWHHACVNVRAGARR